MKATNQLRKEHEGILVVLNVFEILLKKIKNNEDYNLEHLQDILDFLKGFADKCHHGKEEGFLFPKLIQRGMPKEMGPIPVMLHEHDLGRAMIKNISTAIEKIKSSDTTGEIELVENGMNYITLLRLHINKENNALFPMSDQKLSDTDQNQLFDEFEKMEEEVIGIGTHEKYHAMINKLKEIYL
jgi:hemerythrin-like domain-containing protein